MGRGTENLTTEQIIEEVNFQTNTIVRENNPDMVSPQDIEALEKGENNKEDKPKDSKPIKEWVISQSLIKKIVDKHHETKEYCPCKINKLFIEKTMKEEPTESMLKGSFFETLCLGSGAGGHKVVDLERKALSEKRKKELLLEGLPLIGDKKKDQERIEIQAERFKLLCKENEVEIFKGLNTQIKIYKRFSNDCIISGELDIFPVSIMYEGKKQLAIIDLKLTADINSTFGEFSWASPEHMDMLQGDIYHWLVRDIDFELNDKMNPDNNLRELFTQKVVDLIENNDILFLYWIFGYKKEPLEEQDKFVERLYLDPQNPTLRQRDLEQRIRRTISSLDFSRAKNWEEIPSTENCKKCPRSPRISDGTDICETCPKTEKI